MRILALLLCLLAAVFAASCLAAEANKVAVHVQRHTNMNCAGLPILESCADIRYTYDGCDDIDVFPVVYDIYGVTNVVIGLDWPASWGSCAFTPCGFDLQMSDIVYPGDWVSGAWSECRHMRSCVVGFGWLAPSSGGRICPFPNPGGELGVVDCDLVFHSAAAVFCAGVCGADGDSPCGGASEEKTWGSIKSMYR